MREATAQRTRDSQIVVSNSLILLSRRMVLWVFSGVLVLFLPRYLGDQGLGQLAFAQSFAALFATVLSLGLGRFLIKEIARDRAAIKTYLGAAIGLRIVTALLVGGIIVAISQILPYSSEAKKVLYVAAGTMITISFVHLMTSILNGMEDMGWAALADVISKLVVMTVGIAVLLRGMGVVAYSFALLGASSVNLGLVAVYLARRVPRGVRFQIPSVRPLLIGGAPFILMGFLLDIYNQTDTVVLRLLTGEAVVGWYAAANQIYKTIGMVPLAFTAALLPTLSRVYATDIQAAVSMAKKSITIGALGVVPLAVGISLFSREIIVTLPYPDAFHNTVPLLTILALTIPVTTFLVILGTIAVAVDRQKVWAIGLLATVVLNIVLTLLAAPYVQSHYGNGGIGVALTTLLSEILMVSIGVWLMPRGVIDRAMAMTLLKVGVASGAMALVLLLKNLGLDPILAVMGGVVTYGGLVLVTGAVTKEDLRFVRSVVVRKLRPIRPSVGG